MRGFASFFRIALCSTVALFMSYSTALADEQPADTDDVNNSALPSFKHQYDSLAAAMLTFYASSSGSSLQGWVSDNPLQASSLLGSTLTLPSLEGASTPSDLNSMLSAFDLTLELPELTSLDDLMGELRSKSDTLDGRVTLLSAQMATDWAEMQMPTLTMPSLNDTAGTLGYSPESLTFGLFANASITNLVANHPDVFAQVAQSGLGTPQALQAWQSSMLQAGVSVGSNLSRLPMPCLAEMLQGMATGASAGSSSACASCAVAGTYLHNQASSLLDPNQNLADNAPTATATMQPWLEDALGSANGGLATQLDQVFSPTGSITSCSTSSSASSAALSSMLPGLFADLGTADLPAPSVDMPPSFDNLLVDDPADSLPGNFGSLKPR